MNYYYLDAHFKPQGPHTAEEMRELLDDGTLTEDTLAAPAGDSRWRPMRELELPPAEDDEDETEDEADDTDETDETDVASEGDEDEETAEDEEEDEEAEEEDATKPVYLGDCPHCSASITDFETPANCPHCGKPLHPGTMNSWDNAVYAFKRFLSIRGRATRCEFWSYTLFAVFAVCLISTLMGWMLDADQSESGSFGGIVVGLTGLSMFAMDFILIFPWLGVSVRRLHDSGHSGSYMLLHLIPVAALTWFICAALASDADAAIGWQEITSGLILLFSPFITLGQLILMAQPSDEGPNEYGPQA